MSAQPNISGRGEYLPITIKRGVDFVLGQIDLTDDLDAALDLTGCTARASAWLGAVELTFDAEITAPNLIDATLAAAQTAGNLAVLKGEWSLEITWSDGRIEELLYGPVELVGRAIA